MNQGSLLFHHLPSLSSHLLLDIKIKMAKDPIFQCPSLLSVPSCRFQQLLLIKLSLFFSHLLCWFPFIHLLFQRQNTDSCPRFPQCISISRQVRRIFSEALRVVEWQLIAQGLQFTMRYVTPLLSTVHWTFPWSGMCPCCVSHVQFLSSSSQLHLLHLPSFLVQTLHVLFPELSKEPHLFFFMIHSNWLSCCVTPPLSRTMSQQGVLSNKK